MGWSRKCSTSILYSLDPRGRTWTGYYLKKQLKVTKFKCKVILHNSMEEKFMFRKNYHIFILLL